MALGTVTKIDADPTTGTVTLIDSTDTFGYNDPNFSQTGLQLNSPCVFDIDFGQNPAVATNLQPYTSSEKTINTAVSGPLTVASGETLIITKGGIVTGAINTTNGVLRIEEGGAVTGDITDTSGSDITVKRGGIVTGNVVIQNGSTLKVVNKGVIKGNINIDHSNRLMIGNANGGGIVTGAISTKRVRRMDVTPTSTINCG